jgi:hypothetical protein
MMQKTKFGAPPAIHDCSLVDLGFRVPRCSVTTHQAEKIGILPTKRSASCTPSLQQFLLSKMYLLAISRQGADVRFA